VPAPLRKRPMMKASFPDLVGEHRTETVPPEPHCLVTDVEAPLEEQIFDLSVHSQVKLNAVARELNERPRKTLQYHSPAEKFAECVAAIG
jgi:hypothetical protein